MDICKLKELRRRRSWAVDCRASHFLASPIIQQVVERHWFQRTTEIPLGSAEKTRNYIRRDRFEYHILSPSLFLFLSACLSVCLRLSVSASLTLHLSRCPSSVCLGIAAEVRWGGDRHPANKSCSSMLVVALMLTYWRSHCGQLYWDNGGANSVGGDTQLVSVAGRPRPTGRLREEKEEDEAGDRD